MWLMRSYLGDIDKAKKLFKKVLNIKIEMKL